MPTISSALAEAKLCLAHTDSPRLEAEILLAHALGCSRSHLHAWPDKPLSAEQAAGFQSLLARRAAGEPVAYLTAQREFWSLPLAVSSAVLIPRPETELLVSETLSHLPPLCSAPIMDLGTGSGAVALALASERPDCFFLATDRSEAAIRIAQANARRLGIRNVSFAVSDWLNAAASESVCLIAANPPYLAADDMHLQQGDVRHEPRQALAAGPSGLEALQKIADGARRCLIPGGWLCLEHGWDQARALRAALAGLGYSEIAVHRDFAGHDRVTAARFISSYRKRFAAYQDRA